MPKEKLSQQGPMHVQRFEHGSIAPSRSKMPDARTKAAKPILKRPTAEEAERAAKTRETMRRDALETEICRIERQARRPAPLSSPQPGHLSSYVPKEARSPSHGKPEPVYSRSADDIPVRIRLLSGG
jgi:hypothetical protein